MEKLRGLKRLQDEAFSNASTCAGQLLKLSERFHDTVNHTHQKRLLMGSKNGTGVLVSYKKGLPPTIELVDVVIGKPWKRR
jgi:hypothetical protein